MRGKGTSRHCPPSPEPDLVHHALAIFQPLFAKPEILMMSKNGVKRGCQALLIDGHDKILTRDGASGGSLRCKVLQEKGRAEPD
jgi:hypothetical protein